MRLRATTPLASLLIALAALARAHAGPLAEKTAAPRQKIAAEQARYGRVRVKPTSRAVDHPGKTKRTFPAIVGETHEAVFVRIPRYGVQNAMRRHNFVRIAAEQVGRPELIPSAAEVTLAEDIGDGTIQLGDKVREVKAGKLVMIVKDVGKEFVQYRTLVDANREGEVAKAFPEDLRVTGAVLHLLAWQLDGNAKNLLVRAPKKGHELGPDDVRMIDHDVSLGTKHTGPRINGSVFFPGKELAFAGRQERFEDLPNPARALVGALADASASEIATAYGLEKEEAAIVSAAARDIKANGLTGAIRTFETESPKYHDVDYHTRNKGK